MSTMDETSEADDRIEAFLDGTPFAVVGASTDRAKYGNKVLRCYQQNDRTVFPVHPKETEVEGLTAYPNLAALPETPHAVSIITPPPITAKVIQEALDLGIHHVWLQPGAEGDEALAIAEQAGLELIANGPCLLVVLGYRE